MSSIYFMKVLKNFVLSEKVKEKRYCDLFTIHQSMDVCDKVNIHTINT